MRTESPVPSPKNIDPSWRIGIVCSSYYKEEVESMASAAEEYLRSAGITEILLHEAPGCFEIPLIGAALADSKSVDALLGLGIIVEGQTHHARLLAEQSARGIMDTQLRFGLPFAFEILYVRELQDAKDRVKGAGNKGVEAAAAALRALCVLQSLKH